jgi:hypothetical protein
MLNNVPNVQVCDATEHHSCTIAWLIKIPPHNLINPKNHSSDLYTFYRTAPHKSYEKNKIYDSKKHCCLLIDE